MHPKTLLKIGGGLAFLLLAAASSYFINHLSQEHYRKITPARDTTVVTAPTFPDGYIDFLSALNEQFSKDVTPAKNAAVPLYLATDPDDNFKGWKGDALRAGLRTHDVPVIGYTYIGFPEFVVEYRTQGVSDPTRIRNEENDLRETREKYFETVSKNLWTRDTDTLAAAWLHRNEHPLQLIRDASRRDYYFAPLIGRPGLGSVFDADSPGLGRLSAFGDLLSVHALYSLSRGEFSTWGEDVLAQQRLGRLVMHSPTMMQVLVGSALISKSNDLIRATLTALTPVQAQKILTALRALPPIPDLADCVDQGQRLETIAEISTMARFGPAAVTITRDSSLTPLPAPASFGFQAPIHFDDLLREHNHLIDDYVAAMRRATYADRRAALLAVDARRKPQLATASSRSSTDGIRRLIFGTTGSLPRTYLLQDRLIENTRLTQLALLLKAHAGDLPPSLADLPDAGDAARDLFADDKPVHYDPAARKIYSVGPNQRDDGGIFDPPKIKPARSLMQLLAEPDATPDFPDDIAVTLPK